MSLKRGQFRGVLFPGYNYLGPFNPLENGDPVNKADEAAKKHDQAYNKYINKGLNPYLNFNKGDQDFIDSLQSDSSVGGNFARAVFHIKKQIAPALNEPKDTGEPPAKKDKRAGNKRHLYFARLNKSAKKAKADPNNMDGDMGDNEQGAGEAPAAESRAGYAGGAGGGGGGGGGSGNHGVGISTGGWIGGSILGHNRIITRNTRQWVCTIKNDHKYKQYTQWQGSGATIHMQGYSTPWNMFNFNQYSSHFNPNEWQWLLNRAKRFRPVKMEVKIYNLQIKQETNIAGETTYTNDLTAGLHVLCDGEHAFPWTQLPWDKGCMPELPHDVWTLPQYAYITVASQTQDSTDNPRELDIRGAVPMYLLEETDHAVIRTGESIVFHHSFDCGWVDNTRSSVMHQMACINPLVDSRLVAKWVTSGTNESEAQMRPYQKHGPWWPGPGYRDNRVTSNNGTNNQTVFGPYVSVMDPEGVTYQSSILQYGAPTGPYTGGQATKVSSGAAQGNANILRFTPGDGPGGANENNYFTERKSVQTGTRDQTLHRANGNSTVDVGNVYMMPNQMWDSAPISRYNPIWVKVPRVDRHTMLDTEDGTLPMTHPPGTIYVKLANIPAPSTNNNSFLNIYATGQVSCEIEWEYEENYNKNWRPERRIDGNKMRADVYKINDQGNYILPNNYYETMPTRWGQEKVL
uniref:Minor capsid protein VP1 n=1 Tax=Porcine bocavirus 3 TaxID=1084715 RepID=W8GNB3_9VIRU|nr:VP1/VP2 [Porcine bocavirus 3]